MSTAPPVSDVVQQEETARRRGADGAAGKKTGSGGEQRDLIRIKITSCGEGGVGKSCIIMDIRKSLLGVHSDNHGFRCQAHAAKIYVKVNSPNLSGHPEFFDVRNEFYKDCRESYCASMCRTGYVAALTNG